MDLADSFYKCTGFKGNRSCKWTYSSSNLTIFNLVMDKISDEKQFSNEKTI